MRSIGTAPARGAAALVAVALAAGTALGQTGSTLEERARARLVERRLWIEARDDGSPGLCATLGLDDLDVTLRDEPVPAERRVELRRADRRRVHALVIDTSVSLAGSVDRVREAAAGYLATLDPARDTALLIGFDTQPILLHAETGDFDAVRDALAGLRPGGATALWDTLTAAVDEVRRRSARGVVVVLTDGLDSSSLRERGDVLAALARDRSPTVFAIAFNTPPIGGMRRGPIDPEKDLRMIAAATGGRVVEAPTASALDDGFGRIRDILDGEAVLTVVDDRPEDDEPGRLRVRSRVDACRVRVAPEIRPPSPRARHTGSLGRPGLFERHTVDPACEGREPGLGAAAGVLSGCVQDIVFDAGPLYVPHRVDRIEALPWFDTRLRPVRVRLPDPDALPVSPVAGLALLARAASSAPGSALEPHPRRRPPERHARPIADLDVVVNGATFLSLRRDLARALADDPRYRAWAGRRIARAADEERAGLRARWAAAFPDADGARLDALLAASPEARDLAARAESPGEAELVERLAGWLGDVSAYDAVVAWEREHVAAAIRGAPDPRFESDWDAVEGVLHAPSYVRALAPLLPGRAADDGRIGFWRLILPRTSWMLDRVQAGGRQRDDGGPPFDLVPPRPLGWLAVRALLADRAVAQAWRRGGVTVDELRYESTTEPRRRTPESAFDDARVTLRLTDADGEQGLLMVELARRGDAFAVERVEAVGAVPGAAAVARALRNARL